MSALTADVVLKLTDQLTGPAKQATAATRSLLKSIEGLARLKIGNGVARDIERMAKSVRTASSSTSNLRREIARPVKSGFRDIGLDKIKRDAREAASAVRNLRREMNANVRASVGDVAPRRNRRGSSSEPSEGRRALAGVAGVYAAHGAADFGRKTLETYRDFDKESRFSRAVMGISFDDQQALIRQAISLGGSTKFNDIKWLEGQRELAARGLGKDSILGMMPHVGNLATSLGIDIPDAAKQMDAAIFGFKKPIESVAAAAKSAQETADAQVKAAKISGMTPEDIAAVYRFGAAPAKMSGVSENTLLAFGGIEKRANISGDMAGTAFRALIAAAQAPTRGAKEALLANNLDYSKYQPKISNIPVAPFVKNVAAQYGIALNKNAVGALTKVFTNPELLNDQSKFAPAVVQALGGTLNKKDIKAAKSISGMANRFRNSIGGGADVDAFLGDLMLKLPGNLKLSNAIFGAKQGSRIATALGDPKVLKELKEQLDQHSAGYSQKIADARMAGFDGAVSRFEGAVKNLETAFGRSLDDGGKGGFLTNITSAVASFTQKLAEAPPSIQRAIIGAVTAAAGVAGVKGAKTLMDGFGLKGSAVALTEAAAALKGAAVARNQLGGAAGAAEAARKSIPTFWGRGLFMGGSLASLAYGADDGLQTNKDGSMSIKPNANVTGFNSWWDKHMPKWLGSGQETMPDPGSILKSISGALVTPAYGGDLNRHFGGLVGMRALAPAYRANEATGALSSSLPTFAQGGSELMSSLAGGITSGAAAPTSAMVSVLASLKALTAGGIEIPVVIQDGDAKAKIAALMAAAGSVGKTKAAPQFSGALSDGP